MCGIGCGLDNVAGFVVDVPLAVVLSPWPFFCVAYNMTLIQIGSNHDPAVTQPTLRFACFAIGCILLKNKICAESR